MAQEGNVRQQNGAANFWIMTVTLIDHFICQMSTDPLKSRKLLSQNLRQMLKQVDWISKYPIFLFNIHSDLPLATKKSLFTFHSCKNKSAKARKATEKSLREIFRAEKILVIVGIWTLTLQFLAWVVLFILTYFWLPLATQGQFGYCSH